jgi:hypothetical protein
LLHIYAGTFLLGWLARSLVVTLLMPIEEPGAWRVRDMLAHVARRILGIRQQSDATN